MKIKVDWPEQRGEVGGYPNHLYALRALKSDLLSTPLWMKRVQCWVRLMVGIWPPRSIIMVCFPTFDGIILGLACDFRW